MYLGCTIFLTLIYWVTKIMILKYNQKSLDYNHNHIINSYNLFKYGILAHMIMSLMFFMNSKAFSVGDKIKVDFHNNVRLNKLVAEGAIGADTIQVVDDATADVHMDAAGAGVAEEKEDC